MLNTFKKFKISTKNKQYKTFYNYLSQATIKTETNHWNIVLPKLDKPVSPIFHDSHYLLEISLRHIETRCFIRQICILVIDCRVYSSPPNWRIFFEIFALLSYWRWQRDRIRRRWKIYRVFEGVAHPLLSKRVK